MRKIERNLYCPSHGHRTTQELTYVRRVKSVGDWTEADDAPSIKCINYYLAYCKQGDLLLYAKEKCDATKSNPADFELLWPAPGILPPCVPAEVRHSYSEATKAKNDNPDTFGFHIRRGLEQVCDDCGIPRSKPDKKGNVNLSQRIEELVEQRKLPDVMKRMMHVLRDWGNNAVHYHLDPRLVPDVDLFFNGIVHYLYVWPDMLKASLDNMKRMK
jgi:hypothetical protein